MSTGGGFFGGGKKMTPFSSTPITAFSNDAPAPLEGWLDKKSHGKARMGKDWQKR